MSPATVNSFGGVVVPIPTFPPSAIYILDVPFVKKFNLFETVLPSIAV